MSNYYQTCFNAITQTCVHWKWRSSSVCILLCLPGRAVHLLPADAERHGEVAEPCWLGKGVLMLSDTLGD